MSEDQKPPIGQEADPYKNLKSEFDRKLQGLNDIIAKQNAEAAQQYTAILETIKATKQATTSPIDDDKTLEQLSYNEPAKYAKVVEERAARAAESAASKIAAAAQERQLVLSQMISDYPELNDQSSELYQRAVQMSRTLPRDQQDSPNSVKAVIREAAAELGILTKAKRSGSGDFSLGGSRSTGGPSSSSGSKGKIDDKTLAFAEAMGMNIEDPKYLERLEKASKRDTWTRYK